MKKLLLLLFISFIVASAMAQDSLPVYKRFPTVPPFKIMKVPDSSSFKKDDLRKKRSTVVMIFSPDCDHCQHATKDLLENAALFSKAQIVMASNAPYQAILKFYDDYGIAGHTNITMGMDAGYFFGTFYSIKSFPTIIVYDKKGHFVKMFEGSVPFSKIAESL